MVHMKITEAQAELLLLALEYMKQNGLSAYDAVDKPIINKEIDALARAIRLA